MRTSEDKVHMPTMLESGGMRSDHRVNAGSDPDVVVLGACATIS